MCFSRRCAPKFVVLVIWWSLVCGWSSMVCSEGCGKDAVGLGTTTSWQTDLLILSPFRMETYLLVGLWCLDVSCGLAASTVSHSDWSNSVMNNLIGSCELSEIMIRSNDLASCICTWDWVLKFEPGLMRPGLDLFHMSWRHILRATLKNASCNIMYLHAHWLSWQCIMNWSSMSWACHCYTESMNVHQRIIKESGDNPPCTSLSHCGLNCSNNCTTCRNCSPSQLY